MVKATKDNRPFSSGVFDLEEFNIYTKVIDLPLDGIPTYLEEGINGVCTGGSALFNVFSNKRRVVKNDLITIFPYQLASKSSYLQTVVTQYFVNNKSEIWS